MRPPCARNEHHSKAHQASSLPAWLASPSGTHPAVPPAALGCPRRDGDVYIGSGWNELSAGLLIIIVIPLLGLLFAWATYGTLWATGEFY